MDDHEEVNGCTNEQNIHEDWWDQIPEVHAYSNDGKGLYSRSKSKSNCNYITEQSWQHEFVPFVVDSSQKQCPYYSVDYSEQQAASKNQLQFANVIVKAEKCVQIGQFPQTTKESAEYRMA